MNRRTLKKHCARAVRKLCSLYGYRREDFYPACGDESIDAPLSMERRFVRSGFIEPGPLKGTLLYETRGPYGEFDLRLPIDELSTCKAYWSVREP